MVQLEQVRAYAKDRIAKCEEEIWSVDGEQAKQHWRGRKTALESLQDAIQGRQAFDLKDYIDQQIMAAEDGIGCDSIDIHMINHGMKSELIRLLDEFDLQNKDSLTEGGSSGE